MKYHELPTNRLSVNHIDLYYEGHEACLYAPYLTSRARFAFSSPIKIYTDGEAAHVVGTLVQGDDIQFVCHRESVNFQDGHIIVPVELET